MAMTLITNYTWPSAETSLDMLSIPQTYKDLLLLVSPRATTSGDRQVLLQFNGDGANHSSRRLFGTGSSVASETSTNVSSIIAGFMPGSDYTSNTFGNVAMYIPNYTGSSQKTVSIDAVSENNATAARQLIVAGIWASTSAINRISLYIDSGSYAIGTSINLYGIS
jgi:hypothetical protein